MKEMKLKLKKEGKNQKKSQFSETVHFWKRLIRQKNSPIRYPSFQASRDIS